MVNKGLLIGGLAGGVTLFSIAAYALSRPVPTSVTTPPSVTPVLASIKLTTNESSVQVGGSVEATATAYDNSDNVLSGIDLIIFDKTTMTSVDMGVTTSNGETKISLPFKTTGSFVLYAESTTANIKSNSVTITVHPIHSTPPPPPPPTSYTCYVPHCKTLTVPYGGTQTFCVTTAYTSSTPCPVGHQSISQACGTIKC